jgi:hypothetical protein
VQECDDGSGLGGVTGEDHAGGLAPVVDQAVALVDEEAGGIGHDGVATHDVPQPLDERRGERVRGR